MARTEPFQDLAQVRDRKHRLRNERDRIQAGLKAQLDLVREPGFRRAIMGDAFGDMLQAWRPLKHLGQLLGGTSGTTRAALGAAFGHRARTPTGKAMVALASFVLPALLERFGKDHGLVQDRLPRELKVSWNRVKEYVAQRRATHEQSRSKE
ncbi:MAG: hypothetical protein IT225_08200 [Flavobacteriales bacterium]|jgi:hypothetical protein|nr:hypothetical protein [Flavobacteriales bacterium]